MNEQIIPMMQQVMDSADVIDLSYGAGDAGLAYSCKIWSDYL